MKYSLAEIKDIVGEELITKEWCRGPELVGIIITGSVARDEFIEGWSDIDTVMVVKSAGLKLRQELKEWKDQLTEKIGCKVGIEVVEQKQLQLAMSNLKLRAAMFKTFKNFLDSNSYLEESVVFWKSGEQLPVFSKNGLKELMIDVHAKTVDVSLNMYVTEKMKSDTSKNVWRKILKNSLFLMQAYLAKKLSRIISEPEEILSKYEELTGYMPIKIKEGIFWRKKWVELVEVKSQQLEDTWNEFKALVNYNLDQE